MRVMAILPRRLLYFLSDLLHVALLFIIRYRRKTVRKNLRNSFPEYTPSQRRGLTRRFYPPLSDVMVDNMVLQF